MFDLMVGGYLSKAEVTNAPDAIPSAGDAAPCR